MACDEPPFVQVYVYFRQPVAQHHQVAAMLARLIDQIAAETGIAGRVLIRRDAIPNAVEQTWMEIYQDVGIAHLPAFLNTLQLLATACGLCTAAGGARHVEVFQTLAAAAPSGARL